MRSRNSLNNVSQKTRYSPLLISPNLQMDFVHKSIFYLTASERKASIYFEALKKRYSHVTLLYQHGQNLIILSSDHNKSTQRKFALWKVKSSISMYVQTLYIHALIALYLLGIARKRYSIAVLEGLGFTHLSILLSKLGFFKKTVYYAQDWFPTQPLVQKADYSCATHADEFWSLNHSIADARIRGNGNFSKTINANIVMPPLYGPRPNPVKPFEKHLGQFVHMGTVRPGAGFDLIIPAIAELHSKGLCCSLEIIGSVFPQAYRASLENLIRKHSLSNNINIHGYVTDTEMKNIFHSSVCGISLTPGGNSNYSNFATMGKFREYAEIGLPMIVSATNAVAKDVCECDMGLTVADSVDDIRDALAVFVTDHERVGTMAQNAYQYACRMASPERLYTAIERICG